MGMIMNLQAKKLELVQLILNTEKKAVLEQVEALLKKGGDSDWWEELSEPEKETLKDSIKEADEGKLISHDEVLKEVRAKYKLDH